MTGKFENELLYRAAEITAAVEKINAVLLNGGNPDQLTSPITAAEVHARCLIFRLREIAGENRKGRPPMHSGNVTCLAAFDPLAQRLERKQKNRKARQRRKADKQ